MSDVVALVCGGRDFKDKGYVWLHLDAQLGLAEYCNHSFRIIQGGAAGTDQLAREWARSRGVSDRTFRADWIKYGKGAGPIRNQRMLDEGKPDICIAFPGGAGTADMVRRAKAAGVEIVDLRVELRSEATPESTAVAGPQDGGRDP